MTTRSLHKSCSDLTFSQKNAAVTNNNDKMASMKRRSLGSTSFKSFHHTNNSPVNQQKHHIWRSPGNCEIPNILGNAYLMEPCLAPTTTILRSDHYSYHHATTISSVTNTTRDEKKSSSLSSSSHHHRYLYNTNTNTTTKQPPWLPAGSNWTPQPLPPVIRTEETAFEKRLKKTLPKIHLVSMPKSRYVGSKEIGTGVNGAVVQVQVKNQNAQSVKLALKRCKLDADREYRAAIVRELRIMSSGHFNLIKLREAAVFRNEVWIAMDLMRCSVFTVLCVRGLPEECAIYIARETLNALSFLHSKFYIHRDVKCENLLIGPNGEVKLADFGLATNTRHINRERLGTAKWMAPEVIKESIYDEKVDLWSLGITIIEMMDRVPPHYNIKNDDQVFQKVLSKSSPTFAYSYPTIYCTGLVAWLLEDEAANRPTAKDVIAELDLHLEQGLLKSTTSQELAAFVSKTLNSSNDAAAAREKKKKTTLKNKKSTIS